MKQYTHDYTKVSEAESHLYAAQQLNAHDDPVEAWKHIEDARRLLQEYLAQDNMVEDDDVENGWVRYSDAARELEDARKLNAHYRETMLAIGRTGMAAAALAEDRLTELEELKARVGENEK